MHAVTHSCACTHAAMHAYPWNHARTLSLPPRNTHDNIHLLHGEHSWVG